MLPQYTILGMNMIAIPFGLWGFSGYHALPAGALVAGVLWASVNVGLATLVVTVTMVRRHRRGEYRFPVPIVVRIDDPLDLTELAIAEDISLSGFRIYSRLAQEIAVHGKISGHLLLPDVEIPFAAEVVGGNEGGTGKMRTVGCRFLWRDDATRDRLGLFLHGSDLQWRVLGLSERVRTPLENLRVWLTGRGVHSEQARRWIPVFYHRLDVPGDQQYVGLISANTSGSRVFMTYDTLGPEADVQMLMQGKYQRQFLRIKADFSERVGSSAAPVYVYQTAGNAAG